MITLISILIGQGIICFVWYKVGYAKREARFQEGNIIFSVGNETAVIVSREHSIVRVNVINPRLVLLVKEREMLNINPL